MHETPAYGLWSLVIINSAVFICFALSFFKGNPHTSALHLASNVPIAGRFGAGAATARRATNATGCMKGRWPMMFWVTV